MYYQPITLSLSSLILVCSISYIRLLWLTGSEVFPWIKVDPRECRHTPGRWTQKKMDISDNLHDSFCSANEKWKEYNGIVQGRLSTIQRREYKNTPVHAMCTREAGCKVKVTPAAIKWIRLPWRVGLKFDFKRCGKWKCAKPRNPATCRGAASEWAREDLSGLLHAARLFRLLCFPLSSFFFFFLLASLPPCGRPGCFPDWSDLWGRDSQAWATSRSNVLTSLLTLVADVISVWQYYSTATQTLATPPSWTKVGWGG